MILGLKEVKVWHISETNRCYNMLTDVSFEMYDQFGMYPFSNLT